METSSTLLHGMLAYIDPGSSTLVVQMLLAAVIGSLLSIRGAVGRVSQILRRTSRAACVGAESATRRRDEPAR